MKVAIRIAMARDLPALVALCAEHARHERSAFDVAGKVAALDRALFGPTPSLRAWVAERAADLVGYATASPQFSTWAACEYLHLDCLFVRECARARGIGASLLHGVQESARLGGYARMEWQTPAWNEGAIRFYRREGAIGSAKERFRFDL